MVYFAEYCVPGEYGFRCRASQDLKALLLILKSDGCLMHNITFNRALEWGPKAKEGDKFHGGCTFTITKGESRMTEYTSF